MSVQDKLERTLKEIHIALSQGEGTADDPDKVIVDKKEVLGILEKLNLAIYEMMDQYEVTSQAREMAQRRSEKKGEELIARIERQAEDVYAASLIYTDDAMSKVHHLIADALSSSQKIFTELTEEIEKEQRRVKENQLELREQLQDFKDTNKYMVIIEECNREREKEQQEKDTTTPEKRIQNEAKHYAMNAKPEIKVNQAYFQHRGRQESEGQTVGDIPPMPVNPTEEPEEKSYVMPEIKVDLDAEYFKWQEQEAAENKEDAATDSNENTGKKERRFLFGKLNRKESE